VNLASLQPSTSQHDAFHSARSGLLQAMKAGYTSALSLLFPADSQAQQASSLQGPIPAARDGSMQQPCQQAPLQGSRAHQPSWNGPAGGTTHQTQVHNSVVAQQQEAAVEVCCGQQQPASQRPADQQINKSSSSGHHDGWPGNAEEPDSDFARLGGVNDKGGPSTARAQCRIAVDRASLASTPLQGRAPEATAAAGGASAAQSNRSNANLAGAKATVQGAVPNASKKQAGSDKENAATGRVAHHVLSLDV